ncbi:unnamed protein product [Cylicostephanus goldi]|uniref:Uncharacterized protein n=1 Tax=Cylicostephanus goldi TaxID=71465 RepID=A0A3P6SBL1_CYLGO|nr:unnamed protein product [Cylicostephanus goldi]
MLLATAITFVPRKKMHRKRPNRMLSSAFSIASTPMSQCSSQASSCNTSIISPKLRKNGSFGGTPSSASEVVVRQRMKWREREQTPEPMTSPKRAEDYEEMDWEPAANITRSPDVTAHGKMRPSEVMARMVRETTPSRELAPSLSSLSLFGEKQPAPAKSDLGLGAGRPAAFPLGGSRISRSYAPSMANSRFSAFVLDLAKSTFTGLPTLRSLRREDSPTRSTFTSISQREEEKRKPWTTVALVVIAVFSFIVNICLFYMMFRK